MPDSNEREGAGHRVRRRPSMIQKEESDEMLFEA